MFAMFIMKPRLVHQMIYDSLPQPR